MKKIDITGEVCPITFIKVKLKLEEMEPGERLEVLMDDGVPAKNVPKTLKGDGHKIISQGKDDEGSVIMIVEKGENK